MLFSDALPKILFHVKYFGILTITTLQLKT